MRSLLVIRPAAHSLYTSVISNQKDAAATVRQPDPKFLGVYSRCLGVSSCEICQSCALLHHYQPSIGAASTPATPPSLLPHVVIHMRLGPFTLSLGQVMLFLRSVRRSRTKQAGAGLLLLAALIMLRWWQRRGVGPVGHIPGSKQRNVGKGHVDLHFFKSLAGLVAIVVPS